MSQDTGDLRISPFSDVVKGPWPQPTPPLPPGGSGSGEPPDSHEYRLGRLERDVEGLKEDISRQVEGIRDLLRDHEEAQQRLGAQRDKRLDERDQALQEKVVRAIALAETAKAEQKETLGRIENRAAWMVGVGVTAVVALLGLAFAAFFGLVGLAKAIHP